MPVPGAGPLLPAALAIRLGLVVLTLAACRRASVSRRIAFAGSAAVSILTGVTAARMLAAGAPVSGVLLVHRASQLTFTYTIDGLAAWFLLVLSVVATPIAIYSLGYVAHRHTPQRTAFLGAAF